MSRTKTAVRAAIRTATPSSVRAVNRSIMLELIRRHQPISRADLARMTGVFRSSVSDIVDELVAERLVSEERATPSGRGRVPMSLQLNDDSHRIIGLNIRPTHCQIACAGLSGRIQETLTFETPSSPGKLVRAVGKALRHLHATEPFHRMGIAIPGHVDAPTGRILWTPTHPELTGFGITDEIQNQTGIAALADNDCNVGALSELWLSTEDRHSRASDFVFLNVSDFGAGAGAVLNGRIYLGHDAHFAAEFGHMVVDPHGPPCRCGRRGCWELFVSNAATLGRYDSEPFTAERFKGLIEAARQGDSRALDTLRETANYLSLGISNIAFALNPAEVVVAGRITAAWDLIQHEVEAAYGSPQLRCIVRPARFSADDSLLHGAVCLALRETFAAPDFGPI